MAEGRQINLILLGIIFILCVIIGILLAFPHQDTAAGPGISNPPESESRTNNSDENIVSSGWIPTTDIAIIESHFRQDEPNVRVLAGLVRNIGQKTIPGFQMEFNLTDPMETDYYQIGYAVGDIKFLPNTTRDFQAIFTDHNNMSVIKNATFMVKR